MPEPSVAQFLAGLSDSRDLWTFLDVRGLAVRVDHEWHNLLTRCRLTGDKPTRMFGDRDEKTSANILAWQKILPADDIDIVMENVVASRLTVARPPIEFVQHLAPDQATPYRSFGPTFTQVGDPPARPDYLWAGHSWIASGNACNAIMQRAHGSLAGLDMEARRMGLPSLNALAGRIAGFSFTVLNWAASVDVYAPFEAMILTDRSRLFNDELTYELKAASRAATARARVMVSAHSGQSIGIRGPWEPEMWRQIDGYYTARDTLSVSLPAGTTRIVSLALSLGSEFVQGVDLRDERGTGLALGLQLYLQMDPELAILRDQLSGTNASAFAPAVARLFDLGDFYVTLLEGDSRLGEAVDVIARLPHRQLCFAIECTTNVLTAGGKLSRLVNRAKEMQRALGDEVTVYPLMATPKRTKDLGERELSEALSEGVVVRGQDELQALVDLVLRGATPSGMAAFLIKEVRASRVPKWP